MEEKKYYTCFNNECKSYSYKSCSCSVGLAATTCKDRIETKEDILQTLQEDKIKPSYYHKGKVDTITFCQENKLGFCEGNIVKYIVRYADKNGMEDLLKVREYLNRIIESEELKGGR